MIWDWVKGSKAFKNISTIGIATVAGNAVSGLFWIYLAGVLGAESYGQVSYLLAIAGVASNAALLGGTWTMIVYTAKGVKIQSALYIISLISSGIATVVIFVIFDSISIGTYVIGYVIFQLILAELLGSKLFKKYAKFYFLQKIIFICLAYFFYQTIGIEGILIGYGLSYITFFHHILNTLRKTKLDFNILKTKFSFITNNYLYDLVGSFRGEIDKLIIAPMLGFIFLGNYFLGLQIIGMLGILPGIVFSYVLPMDASGKSTSKVKKITLLFSGGFTLVGIFLVPIFLPAIFPEYTDSVKLIPILSLSLIPMTLQNMFTSKLLGKEKTKYVLISYLISIFVLVSGIIVLGNMFDLEGIAVAFVLSQISYAFLTIIFSRIAISTE